LILLAQVLASPEFAELVQLLVRRNASRCAAVLEAERILQEPRG
jgi:hypothetical protein